ncbi:MAG: Pentapeptide repeat protein [Thermoanaerobacterium thermosaccharolyticum]|jgi:hypothetical protein
MPVNKINQENFNYNNIDKVGKNFMYKNLRGSKCYNCNFANSNFNYASFRGAHFKLCKLVECSFKWTEFIGANLKDSNFKFATFENTVFDSVKLDGANFKDAQFENTIFLNTDVTKAKNLDLKSPGIKILNEMPDFEISSELKTAITNAMKNKYVKDARIFDTKDGSLNMLNIMILLENFDEKTLIEGLNLIENELDRKFYTLSYVIKYLKS